MHPGSCLCGAVRFEVAGELPAPDACHCTRCRKASGHVFVSTDVARAALRITGEDNICWYSSSIKARRGFCRICGATLFWDPSAGDWIGIAMGAFDGPTHTQIAMHIYVADKGDYYQITDDAPQLRQLPGPTK